MHKKRNGKFSKNRFHAMLSSMLVSNLLTAKSNDLILHRTGSMWIKKQLERNKLFLP